MIEIRPHYYKHGWRKTFIGENKTVLWGFKQRRRAIMKFEGRRMGMKRSLAYGKIDEDYRKYFWRLDADYEAVQALLANCVGMTYQDAQRKFLDRMKRHNHIFREDPIKMFNYYVGLKRHRYRHYTIKTTASENNVSWLGFYIDENGILRERRSEVYDKYCKFKPRRVSKKYEKFNRIGLAWPAEDPKGKPWKMGLRYVIRMETNKLVSEPVPVWLMLGAKYDRSRGEKSLKDKALMEDYIRINVVGLPNDWVVPNSRQKYYWSHMTYGLVYYYVTKRKYVMDKVKFNVEWIKGHFQVANDPSEKEKLGGSIIIADAGKTRGEVEEKIKETMEFHFGDNIPDWFLKNEYVLDLIPGQSAKELL